MLTSVSLRPCGKTLLLLASSKEVPELHKSKEVCKTAQRKKQFGFISIFVVLRVVFTQILLSWACFFSDKTGKLLTKRFSGTQSWNENVESETNECVANILSVSVVNCHQNIADNVEY